MATHDIYIYPTDKGKSSGIRIPWLPSSVEFDLGGMRAESFEILHSGEVERPDGTNLGSISFKSIFPGEAKKNLPFLRGSWKAPKSYQKKLTSWLTKGTKLTVIMTGTPINHKVFVSEFIPSYSGPHGDITYSLTLKCRRDITIKTVKKAKSKKTAAKKKNKSTTRKSTPTTYTIKKGDTLWAIAKKYLGKGSRYTEIYKANKSIIEKTAKKHGKKSSDGGHWIYPGTSIKIPKK